MSRSTSSTSQQLFNDLHLAHFSIDTLPLISTLGLGHLTFWEVWLSWYYYQLLKSSWYNFIDFQGNPRLKGVQPIEYAAKKCNILLQDKLTMEKTKNIMYYNSFTTKLRCINDSAVTLPYKQLQDSSTLALYLTFIPLYWAIHLILTTLLNAKCSDEPLRSLAVI
jgi:hypothetical protein